MTKILFLAANPKDTDRIRLDEEARSIQERLRVGTHSTHFNVVQEWAIRVSDLQGHLLRHQPQIVHFSGHGSRAGEIVLEDLAGRKRTVSPAALKRLFATLQDEIQCVVLNACYSEIQARAIADSIDCVIGMSSAIGDDSAISFATSFYQGLAFGRDVHTAFELGCGQIGLESLEGEDTPKLIVRQGVDPKKYFLTKSNTKDKKSFAKSQEASAGERRSTSDPIEVFYSYSHKDEKLREKLEAHLSILKRQHVIYGWHDRKITAGSEWKGQIAGHLESAKIILLLVSADFLASDYCYDVEMRRAMDRHDAGEAEVIPVILRPCDWHSAPFGKLQALPTDGRAVSDWPKRDKAFLEVALGIRRAIESESSTKKDDKSRSSQAPSRNTGQVSQGIQHALAQYLCASEAIVTEKTRDFVGRDFVFQELDSLLKDTSSTSGYLLIEGQPGIGKTAIIAKLVDERGYIHHFNNALQGVNSDRDFLGNVCAQVVMREGLSYDQFPLDMHENGNFLNRILQEASTSLNGRKLVIAIDALDEVAGDRQKPGNLLFLPSSLPAGIYVVATSRPIKDLALIAQNVRHFVLDSMSPENLNNIATYIEVRLPRPGIRKWIRDRKLTEEQFVSNMKERSEGNFMYLHHVLPDVEKGRFKDFRLEDLPYGLRQYYREHWKLMRANRGDAFEETHERVICILAAAREAVTATQVADWTLIDIDKVNNIIGAWREFLYQEASQGGSLPFRIYHASFRDYLSEEVDPGLRKYHRFIAASEFERLKSAGLDIPLEGS